MKVLITGANGQLGLHVQTLLTEKKIPFIATDVTQLDITNYEAVQTFITRHKPTLIINTAAYNAVDQAEVDIGVAFTINAAGPYNLARAAKAANAVLVHISTDFVFEGGQKSPYVETDQPRPQSMYAASKLAGEQLVSAVGGEFFIIRTAWLYGDVGKNFPTAIIVRARNKKPLTVVADQIGCPTYAKDLAEAIWALTQTKKYGLYHGVNKGSASWYSFAQAILKEIELDATVRAQTTQQYFESAGKSAPSASRRRRIAERPKRSVLATDKLQKETGYTFRAWQEALHEWAQKKKV